MPPVSEAADAPKQIFGQPIEDGRVSEEFVKSAGFKTTVFETEQPSPLFPPREQAQAPSAEPFAAQQAFAVPQAYEVPPAPVVEPFAVPPSSLDVAAQAPLPQAYQPEVVAQPIAEPAAPPIVAAAPAAPLPSPAGLGMDDLSARLAASMARRRAARSGAAPEAEVPVAVAPAFTAPQPEPAAPVAEAAPQFSAPELPPMPQAFEPAPQPAVRPQRRPVPGTRRRLGERPRGRARRTRRARPRAPLAPARRGSRLRHLHGHLLGEVPACGAGGRARRRGQAGHRQLAQVVRLVGQHHAPAVEPEQLAHQVQHLAQHKGRRQAAADQLHDLAFELQRRGGAVVTGQLGYVITLASLAIGGIVSWSYVWFRPSGRLTPVETADRIAAIFVPLAASASSIAFFAAVSALPATGWAVW